MQDRMQSRNRLVNLAASALVDPLFHLFLFAARTFRDRAQGDLIAVNAFFNVIGIISPTLHLDIFRTAPDHITA